MSEKKDAIGMFVPQMKDDAMKETIDVDRDYNNHSVTINNTFDRSAIDNNHLDITQEVAELIPPKSNHKPTSKQKQMNKKGKINP